MWDQSKFLEDKLTKITEKEAVLALREAFKNVYTKYPSNNSLAILYAQTALETGRFSIGFHCYNWGNIKSRPTDGFFWTMFRCSEIINGVNTFFDPPHDQCKFRAYKTAIDGAEDYIKFLAKKTRYAKAWAELLNGNPEKYSHELKVAGYYTANEALYTKGVISLTNEFHKKLAVTIKDPNITVTTAPDIKIIFSAAELSAIENSHNRMFEDYFRSSKHDEDEDNDKYFEIKKIGFWDQVKKIFKL